MKPITIWVIGSIVISITLTSIGLLYAPDNIETYGVPSIIGESFFYSLLLGGVILLFNKLTKKLKPTDGVKKIPIKK